MNRIGWRICLLVLGAAAVLLGPSNVLAATPAPGEYVQNIAPEPSTPIDQYEGSLDPNNPLILLDHLRCAAFELPFQSNEAFGNLPAGEVQEYLEYLTSQGVLHSSNARYYWMADQYPAQQISLRNASPNQILLQVAEVFGQDAETVEWIGLDLTRQQWQGEQRQHQAAAGIERKQYKHRVSLSIRF